MDYPHYNPVKHGWAQPVKDWPYSSFHRLVEKGFYPLDWAGSNEKMIDMGEPGNKFLWDEGLNSEASSAIKKFLKVA
jgi:hypothetical protein